MHTVRRPGATRIDHTYVLLTAVRWLPTGLLSALMVLAMRADGLRADQVGLLFALHGLVAVCVEVPSGALADAVGRRPVLLAASLLHLVFYVGYLYAETVPGYAVLMTLLATARAMDSGALEAWYADAVLAERDHVALARGLAHGGAAQSAALAVGALVGGLGAEAAQRIGAQPFGLEPAVVGLLPAVFFGAAHLLSTLRVLAEGPRGGGDAREPRRAALLAGSLTGTLRLVTAHRGVRVLLALSAAVGAVIISWETLWPARLTGLVPGPAGVRAVGLVLAASYGASALAAAVTGRLAASRPLPALVVSGMVMAGATVALAAASTGGLSAGGLIGAYLGLGGIAPMQRALLHRVLSARERATALSVDSLCLQFGVIVGGVALSRVAQEAGAGPAWLIGAVVLAAVTALVPRALRPRIAPARNAIAGNRSGR